MSWQTYVDSNLLGTGKIAHAAILGQQGGVWATSPGFTLSPQEQSAIVGAWNDLDRIQANGVRLAGTKYFTIQTTPGRSIYGKSRADGCIIVKTKQAILVTVYNAPVQAAEATPVVESLADYLISVDY
ncbi:hypothetical protein M407DRAFT_241334 [Tulasnella calospora MUT 4182]|uniref:Profilin n=1 Tax=Tulasnella calospora MUT 4182 TaxID=1051891 RepID=A0A0C3QVG5_9AGAM|nr:hypothetical protein M407DRAFT_241334 [Tulasnella calospora MUT 4182]